MTTDKERREVVERLRNFDYEMGRASALLVTDDGVSILLAALSFAICDNIDTVWKDIVDRLADLIEPDPALFPSGLKSNEWQNFSKEPPPKGKPILCREGGIYYVGRLEVEPDGTPTNTVWVVAARGGEYRHPDEWIEFDEAEYKQTCCVKPSKEASNGD